MQNDILSNGVILLMFGMGVVFIFLSLLVVAIQAMSFALTRFFPPPELPPPAFSSLDQPNMPPQRILDVIQAAIAEHRKQPS